MTDFEICFKTYIDTLTKDDYKKVYETIKNNEVALRSVAEIFKCDHQKLKERVIFFLEGELSE